MSLMQQYASQERRTKITAKIESLLGEMKLREKVGQLNQLNGSDQTGPSVGEVDLEREICNGNVGSVLNVDGFGKRKELQRIAVEETRLGIPLLFGFDVVHGYRTLFPIPLGEAASWDRAAVKEAASVAATETAAAGVHWTFGPPVDVTRDARWGRAMETSGEDPHLGSELAAARVRGFQGKTLRAEDTVLACAKHFAGYGDSKAGREYNTVDIAESTLRELHLPPFKAAVEAGVGTIMNSFNVHDRIPAGANEHLISDILKDEWGFDGFVVSDWNSFREFLYHGVASEEREVAELAIEAGSDMDMVGHVFVNELANLVEDGVVKEAVVDDAVRRVLQAKFLVGLFEDPYRYFDEQRQDSSVLTDEHRETARDVARKSIVLLKNEGNVLPISTVDDVAIVGALADSKDDVLGNWRARGQPEDAVTVLEGVKSAVPAGTNVQYATGYERSGEVTDSLLEEAVETTADADIVVVTVGETWELSGECSSRAHIDLPGDQRELLKALQETDTPVIAVLMNGRPLSIPWMDEHIPTILETWFLGTQAGDAIADVLFGEYNPSGSLPMSFPQTVGQIPINYNQLPTGRPAGLAEPGWSTSYIDVPNEPLYTFGHGLSYTSFDYADFTLDKAVMGMDELLRVHVTVKNTGEMVGEEVVQLYVRDLVGSRSRPVKELIRFQKIEIEQHERREVTFDIASEDLAFWTADEEFAAETGTFELMVGRSAEDIRSTATFELQG